MNISDLIELERKATKGEWIVMPTGGPFDGEIRPITDDDRFHAPVLIAPKPPDGDNFDSDSSLVVALRNRAVAFLEVVKAAREVMGFRFQCEDVGGDPYFDALAAALAKLEGVE